MSLGNTTVALVLLTAGVDLVRLLLGTRLTTTARDYLDGSITETEFLSSINLLSSLSLVFMLVQVGAVISTLIWLFRIARNNLELGRGGTWGPGWAIGGWFVPPILTVIPTLLLQQQWKASDPSATISTWRGRPSSPTIWAWGVFYTASAATPLIERLTNGPFDVTASRTELAARTLANPTTIGYARVGLVVVAALLFAMLAVPLTKRHAELTGEAPT